MFSYEEMNSIPMSDLVVLSGADWEAEDDSYKEHIEACILSNTIKKVQEELLELESLFLVYHDKNLINNYNRLLRELKLFREQLSRYW